MNDYGVTYLVKAIVELRVTAKTEEEAQGLAEARMKKIAPFNATLSYIDGSITKIGFSNNSAWNEIDE